MSGVYSTPPRYLGWLAAGELFEILTLKIEFSGYFQYVSLYITVLVTVLHMLHIKRHAHHVHAHQYMHVQATHFPPRQ